MATITPVTVRQNTVNGSVHQTLWEAITTSGDTINAADGKASRKSFHVQGIFDAAVINIVGSNTGATATDFVQLHTTTGGNATFTSTVSTQSNGFISDVREVVGFIKPTASGVGNLTDIDIRMISYYE